MLNLTGAEGKYLESKEVADYEKFLNAFIEEDCDLIITVGFLIGDATKAAAEANPEVKFSIVDFNYDPLSITSLVKSSILTKPVFLPVIWLPVLPKPVLSEPLAVCPSPL